jgi:SIR2-like protein
MPDFVALARRIAEGKIGWDERRYKERLDRYLGDAERRGVDVQTRARDELRPNGRTHTPMHEHLLGLFEVAERVRLITTNFEPFFDMAADAVYPGSSIRRFIGPALPPGRDFKGMVQLHGALSQLDYDLVLTDSNFASAYMADGWATRFLLGVFRERTVLFVGYGLNDPVMQYLIRAIPPTGRWYSLTREAECEHWEDMRIVPIPFKPALSGEPFGDLNGGVQRWREYAQSSVTEHERSLRELIQKGPPSSPLDEDYIRERLKTATGRTTFWQHARSLEWLAWLGDRHYLDPLTQEFSDAADAHGWATWLVEYYLDGARPGLLQFLRRRPFTPSPVFASTLAFHLARPTTRIDRDVLRQLIVWLCNQSRILPSAVHEYTYLLEKLVADKRGPESLFLLRTLTRPRLAEPELLFLAYEDQEEAEPSKLPALSLGLTIWPGIRDLHYYLEKHGAALAAIAPHDLLRLGIERVREAYEIQDLAGASVGSLDWLSYRRTAIAPSGQDLGDDLSDILVVMIREAVDALLMADPDAVLVFARTHSQDQRKLLRRLALYAFARHGTVDADELLDLARAEGWARDSWLRPELYQLLRAHYARSSESAKERFIADLDSDAWWGEDDE